MARDRLALGFAGQDTYDGEPRDDHRDADGPPGQRQRAFGSPLPNRSFGHRLFLPPTARRLTLRPSGRAGSAITPDRISSAAPMSGASGPRPLQAILAMSPGASRVLCPAPSTTEDS